MQITDYFPDIIFGDDIVIAYGKAPGRTNIIGEHIDYCGYSVLPMALEQTAYVLSAISITPIEDGIDLVIRNINRDKYIAVEVDTDARLQLLMSSTEDKVISWSDYVLCGMYVAKSLKRGPKNSNKISVLVDGSIPQGSGLSSSSALVVASALSFCSLFGIVPSMDELARLTAEAERLVGTLGGGMDQTISCLAVERAALHISFGAELKYERVYFPENVTFVLCDSLVNAIKSAQVKIDFNTRVIECRVAAIILAASLAPGGLDLDQIENIKNLSDFERIFRAQTKGQHSSYPLGSIESLREVHQYALSILHEYSYSGPEIDEAISTISKEKRVMRSLFSPESKNVFDRLEETDSSYEKGFQLHKRVNHVFSEAIRVLQFKEICVESKNVTELGCLMNASHDSLRDLYECSCKELDELVVLCRTSGALGSRLTGAGWGGMVVSMVCSDEVDRFMRTLAGSDFYASRLQLTDGNVIENFETILFSTRPSTGASYGYL